MFNYTRHRFPDKGQLHETDSVARFLLLLLLSSMNDVNLVAKLVLFDQNLTYGWD